MEESQLANASEKRHRQSLKRRLRNRSAKSRVRTEIRKLLSQVQAGDETASKQQFVLVTKLVDTAAGKGVWHKRTAARTKSRLQKKVNALQNA